MKLTLTILTFTILMGAGKIMHGQKKNETQNKFIISDFYREQIINYDTIISDTIEFKDYRFVLSSIDSVEYFSTLDNYFQNLDFYGIEMYLPNARNFEKAILENDELIQYTDTTFTLSMQNGSLTIPKFTKTGGEGAGNSMDNKIYIGFASELDSFVFLQRSYEGLRFYTVNRKTNEKLYISGFPKLSPTGKFLLSSYYDIEIGFFPNGFNLYSLETNNTELVFEYWNEDFDNFWGPEGMIWKDDSTFYMIRIMPYKESHNGQWEHRCLQKLEIKKNASR